MLVVVLGLVFGATTALSTGDSGYLGTLLKSGLAYLPAELVIAAVAVLFYGSSLHSPAWQRCAVTSLGCSARVYRSQDWVPNLLR